MVIPTTSRPCSTSSAAATDESTPPLMPTTIRSAISRGGFAILVSRDLGRRALVPRAEQVGQTLELVRRRVADLDLTLAFVADDPDARHQAALKRFLERCHLDRPPAALSRRQAACPGERFLRADGILCRPHGRSEERRVGKECRSRW